MANPFDAAQKAADFLTDTGEPADNINNPQNSIARNTEISRSVRRVANATKANIIRKNNPFGKFNELVTAGRALVSISGLNTVMYARSVSWNITIQTEECRSIDTNVPWDLAPGQISIQATVSDFYHPNWSGEEQALFTTAAAAIHQPLVELEVYDALGTKLFLARGIFNAQSTTIDNDISKRQYSFVGIVYAHAVQQRFVPYLPSDTLQSVIQKAKKLAREASRATGGVV